MVFQELKSILLFYRERRRIHESAGDYGFNKDPHERNLILERTSRFMARQVGRVGLRPGVRESLEQFRKQGLRVVALSDHYSDAKLRALGVHHLFDGVYAAETTGHLKPHPEGFMAVCKGENIAPHQLLHIGDRDETDGEGARSAGAHCLILDIDFKEFSELRIPEKTPG
jgi:HAD superfamily hydrolase (TIGR01509 family)